MVPGLIAAGLLGLGLGIAGCAVEQPSLGTTAGLTFEELKARASREPGTGAYVVDWDHVIHGDDALRELHDRFQQGALAIYTDGGVDVTWSAAEKHNLTYCVSDAFGARKQTVIEAMRAAADEGWETMADVNFVHVPAQDASCTAHNAGVVFDINPITSAPYLARAFFPDTPRAQRNLMVDGTAFELRGTIALTNVLAHELGHALGFRHEHIRPEAAATADCLEDDQFRGVTTYDSASVMHYPQCNGTSVTLAFTTRDQEGVAAVYGAPDTNASPLAQLTTPVDGATVGASFTVEAAVVDRDLARAELFVDGTLHQTLTAAPFSFAVTDQATGPHALEIKATDSIGQVGTQTITITVANVGTDGGGHRASAADGAGEGAAIEGGCSTAGGGASLIVGIGVLLARRRPPRHRARVDAWAAATSGPGPGA